MPDQFQFNGPIHWTQFIIILQFNKTVTYQFLGWFEPILSFDGKVAILTPLIFTWQNNNKYLKFKKERKKKGESGRWMRSWTEWQPGMPIPQVRTWNGHEGRWLNIHSTWHDDSGWPACSQIEEIERRFKWRFQFHIIPIYQSNMLLFL